MGVLSVVGIAVGLGLTVLSVVLGLVQLIQGNTRRSQAFMKWRVNLQLATVMFIGVLAYLAKTGGSS